VRVREGGHQHHARTSTVLIPISNDFTFHKIGCPEGSNPPKIRLNKKKANGTFHQSISLISPQPAPIQYGTNGVLVLRKNALPAAAGDAMNPLASVFVANSSKRGRV